MASENVVGFIPVLIIQTSTIGFIAARKELQEAGFVGGVDFVLGDQQELTHVDGFVVAGATQLLVTGTFHNDEVAAADFVRRMKERNRKLKAVFYSAMAPGDQSCYDFFMKKRGVGELAVVVRNFLRR